MSATAGLASIGLVWLAVSLVAAFWLDTVQHPQLVATTLLLAIPYAAGAWWVLRHEHVLDTKRSLALILGLATIARLALLPAPPHSTDIYRYVWDGRVQAAGINPYRHVPADPAVSALRDDAVFPHINRAATAVTIYPPAAEMVFWAATRVHESVLGMKVAVVLFEAVGIAAVLALLRTRDIPASRIVLYVWHPVPLVEFAGSGHVDGIAIALMLVACWAADRRWPALAGLVLALGAGVKYFPAFITPALYRRFDWRMPVAFTASLVLVYLPYLGVGRGVLGFLPGYLGEEGLAETGGVVWLSLIDRMLPLPAWAPTFYLALAGAVLLCVGLAIVWRTRPDLASLPAAMLLLAGFTVAVTPHYTWYYAWTVPFLCIRPTVALIWLTASSPLLYGVLWPYDRGACEALIFVTFLLILAAEFILRRRPALAPEYSNVSRVGHQSAA